MAFVFTAAGLVEKVLARPGDCGDLHQSPVHPTRPKLIQCPFTVARDLHSLQMWWGVRSAIVVGRPQAETHMAERMEFRRSRDLK